MLSKTVTPPGSKPFGERSQPLFTSDRLDTHRLSAWEAAFRSAGFRQPLPQTIHRRAQYCVEVVGETLTCGRTLA